MFENHEFDSARHTSVLFHNEDINEISRKIQLLKINATPALLELTKTIKLNSRMDLNMPTKREFKRYESWLSYEFPYEVLKLFEYKINGGK